MYICLKHLTNEVSFPDIMHAKHWINLFTFCWKKKIIGDLRAYFVLHFCPKAYTFSLKLQLYYYNLKMIVVSFPVFCIIFLKGLSDKKIFLKIIWWFMGKTVFRHVAPLWWVSLFFPFFEKSRSQVKGLACLQYIVSQISLHASFSFLLSEISRVCSWIFKVFYFGLFSLI
jgi:hypothetical protein